MIDWTKPMGQRFRFYEVDRGSWKDAREITGVVSCDVTRDLSTALRESASLVIVDEKLPEETVVRAYMECEQGGAWERFGIGTWICQTPKRMWRHGVGELEVRAYSTLLGPSDDKPPVMKTVRKGQSAADQARLALENGIAPVIRPHISTALTEPYTCDEGDSWLDLANAMAEAVGCVVMVGVDGRPYLALDRDQKSLSPTWEYRDDENSILLAGIDDLCDWFALPNVAEIIVSNDAQTFVGQAVNADGASSLSTVSRGRRVVLRENGDELPVKSQAAANRRAKKLLSEQGSAERRLTYSHGYCPVQLGDCVRVRSKRYKLDVRAKVVKQTMRLETGCTVTEEATCEMRGGGV